MNWPVEKSIKSIAFNQRIRFLVLHYTATDFITSLAILTQKLSSHYLVPDPDDATCTDSSLKIYQLVDETDRAWHAGISNWEDRVNINDTSIGIEIVNQASYSKAGGFIFPPFNTLQIEAVTWLCRDILSRYPEITPTRIVGHADIAPALKSDPGAAFPWEELHKNGVGAWYTKETKNKYTALYEQSGLPDAQSIQKQLAKYGYKLSITGAANEETRYCLRAFQLHFRPEKHDGIADIETMAILSALNERYHS